MKIFKYSLAVIDYQAVLMPPLSSVLKVEFQDGQLCAWAVVDDTLELTDNVEFWIVGTGNEMPEMKADAMYVDTVSNNGFVWHVFSGPCYD